MPPALRTHQDFPGQALFLFLLGFNALAAPPAWIQRDGYREAPAEFTSSAIGPRLALTDPVTTGLRFTNSIPESRHLTNQVLLNGSGLAAGDVDGDGFTDVFCAGFENDNALFRNRGNWTFEDVTARAGVALPGFDCTGAAFADLDGDGDLDLVVNSLVQGTSILFNDGAGRFERHGPVLNPGRGAMTTAIADIDGDGFLDLYLVNYRPQALMDMPNTRMTFRKSGNRSVVDTVNGRPATDPEFANRFVVNEAGGIEENGEPDVLYRNVEGTGFAEIPWTGGRFLDDSGAPLQAPPRDWGLSAMFRDLNGDGHPDLYVCNDFQSPDRLWRNQGDGRFRLAPALALRRTSLSSMAVDFADLNGDGHDDFLVLEMLSQDHRQRMRWVRGNFPHRPVIGLFDDQPQIEQNTLQLARGDGTWAEIASLSGLEATEWSWACAFLDVDLDGWSDVLVANGMERAGRDLDAAERLRANRQGRNLTPMEIFQARRIFPRLATPNLAFRNQGDLSFVDVSRDWGFDLPAVSQSLALADLDNDGDLDVLVGNLNASLATYRNGAIEPRVAVRLAGRPPNTRGIGARIELVGGPVPQSQEIIAGGRYLSGDDPVRSFAAGGAARLTVRVRWPGGARSEVANIRPNSLVEIREPEPRAAATTPQPESQISNLKSQIPAPAPRIAFEDLSSRLNHLHHEEPADDFARQPLLPHKLSQPGPGVAWIDLDGDGDDDLAIGAGMNGRLALFRNQAPGRLEPWDAPALAQPLSRDTTALIAFPQEPRRSTLLAAVANYEDGAILGPAVIAFNPAQSALGEPVEAAESSPGPLALADIDGDGDLDLFVGGRVVPGRWPAAASSRFLRNDGGRFLPDPARSRVLASIGLVSGAVFSDLDADGDADLALACEWGPVRILRQDRDGFTDITRTIGLDRFHGGWTSVAAGDFDQDGRIDLVAGNWGRNTPWQRHCPVPGSPDASARAPKVYHGDFDQDGTYDALQAYHDPTLGATVPAQPLTVLASALPFLRGKFPSHEAFGGASIETVLGEALAQAEVVHATQFETTVFLNRDQRFEDRRLPVEAQFAPVFGIAVADADGDGDLDLFLAQNFFAVRPHTPRFDAGLGLWLENDGQAGFRFVPGAESGVKIFGEQRGAAVGDFDQDGRIDLVVGQNGSQTRLFRNVGAVAALRVRLEGPPSNPAGIGARLRWSKTPTPSPAREIHAGSGYLSQDSLVTVMARPAGDATLEVAWPGGRTQSWPVSPDIPEAILRYSDASPASP